MLSTTTIIDNTQVVGLGDIIKGEIESLDLFQQRIEMQELASCIKNSGVMLEQYEAEVLNNKYRDIVMTLEFEYELDLSEDYLIDFNAFVLGHKAL